MEAVKLFNSELSSLYDVKPPISKAKMTAITRGAIKAIKFYKHVVQSVEKFILKCKPEYKVPGLYVIDSIVRQSRHQFGPDKDVFAPRFAKNMRQTFVNLFMCPAEDKSKIIRVLNLWQKNQVFAAEVIQPLFDLADPNNPIHKELGTPLQSNGMNASAVKGSPALQKTPTKGSQQGVEGAHLGGANLNLSDPNVLVQLQQLQRLLTRSGESAAKTEGPVHFDRKLLDFDYGDDDDEAHSSPKAGPAPTAPNDSVSSLLTNPEVLRQLQTIQQTMTAGQPGELDIDKLRKLQEMKQQEEEFDKHLAQTVPNLPFASEIEFKPSQSSLLTNPYYLQPPSTDMSQPPPGYKQPPPPQTYDPVSQQQQQNVDNDVQYLGTGTSVGVGSGVDKNDDNDVEVITLDHGDSRSPTPTSDDRYGRRRRTRSRERSRDRRDRDRERDRRSRRSRSRSKTRRHRSRSRERDRSRTTVKEKESEKDKERKKRGLPAIRKENLSVCSTTLWVGHLSKLVHQEDLSNTFGEFGDIVSIDLIPPRGCAFIVMHRRQDAARCLTKLKNHVLHGKAITLAWAPGKGVKGKDLKDYWEGDLGVSYIPWHKLSPDIDLDLLEDGGMIDEDTMPAWMKAKAASTGNKSNNTSVPSNISDPTTPVVSAAPFMDTSQPPPVTMQPPPMALPLVSPFQFNNRLLGMNLLPNVPIGVPPPNLQGAAAAAALVPNPLVGLGGSPFMPPTDQGGSGGGDVKSLMYGGGMMPPPQPMIDDNMDVEMEDAVEKPPERPMLLSEQLQASMAQFGNNRGGPGEMMGGDVDERRDRRNDRSRERDRDRNRDRERGSGRYEDGRGGGGRNDRKDDRRDRPNRWGDRNDRDRPRTDRERDRGSGSVDRERTDHRPADRPDRDREVDLLERREREKTLNDRLQQLAMPNEPPLYSGPPPPPPTEHLRHPIELADPADMMLPPPAERRGGGGGGGPPPLPPPQMFHEPEMVDMYGMGAVPPPHDNYVDMVEGGGGGPPPMMMEEYPPGPEEWIPPPRMMHRGEDYDAPPDQRFGGRGGRRGGDFRENRGRPEFYPPPRDNFGPRGMPPMMRGDFGPPMRGGMRGKFHPRSGGPMRGPRPAPPWKERPNFGGPRFEHPDFHRGGGGGGPMFDEPPPPHMRMHGGRGGGRFEDRRRGPPRGDFGYDNMPDDRFHRRSRWGESHDQEGIMPPEPEPTPNGGGGDDNRGTPLHDEQFSEEPPLDPSMALGAAEADGGGGGELNADCQPPEIATSAS